MAVLAYLDPGTGGLIVQAVLGGVAGIAVAAKAYGRRFTRRKGSAGEEQAVPESEPVTTPVEADEA